MGIIIDIGFRVIAAIVVVIFREYIKSVVAFFVMHPVIRENHKLELDFRKYIDPFGLIMFVFSGIGWQKPAEYMPRNYKDKNSGVMAVAAAGFLSNILLLIAAGISLKFVDQYYLKWFLRYLVNFNVALTVVNLLPVPPLDMVKILYVTSNETYFKIIQNQRIIHTIFLILFVFGFLSYIVTPITQAIYLLL